MLYFVEGYSVLQAIPVQALKIIVVVWQILTQVRHMGGEC